MDIITITDNDINEIIAVYSLDRFIREVNKEHWEANNFNGSKDYFNIDTIDFAINWYIVTNNNLSINRYTVEE